MLRNQLEGIEWGVEGKEYRVLVQGVRHSHFAIRISRFAVHQVW